MGSDGSIEGDGIAIGGGSSDINGGWSACIEGDAIC